MWKIVGDWIHRRTRSREEREGVAKNFDVSCGLVAESRERGGGGVGSGDARATGLMGMRTRLSVVNHYQRDQTGKATWYDMVCGPVAAFWQQRSAMLDADQYSFHTVAAEKVLNSVLAATRGRTMMWKRCRSRTR